MNRGAKVLLVDDEPSLLFTLRLNLAKEGMDVHTATDGHQGLRLARQVNPDLVVLDIMLPDMDGFEMCRELRKTSNVPILFLSGRVEEIDRVVGLEIGGDCYMTKPFSLREFIAQVKALLRRHSATDSQSALCAGTQREYEVVQSGDLSVDLGWRRVTLGGDVIALSPKEYDLLVFMIKNKRIVLDRDALFAEVWGYEYRGDSKTIEVHIRWLRQKIEKDPANPQRIETVRGVGYCFTG